MTIDSAAAPLGDAADTREARDAGSARGPSLVPAAAPLGVERIRTVVVDDHEEIARLVAARIATLVRERAAAGRPLVLGLATGSTPIGVYRELIRMHREEGLSLRHVVTFNLDEYYPMAPDSIHAYHRYMWENLFAHINIAPENVHIPAGQVAREEVERYCRDYEAAIQAHGGIDFQLRSE